MRTLLILLLLCWVSSTDGLKCYVCDPSTGDSNCNNMETCPVLADTCMTTAITAGNTQAKMKTCINIVACKAAAAAAQLVTGTSVTCCSTDLCNGATTSRLHTLLLALPLAAICALRYVTA